MEPLCANCGHTEFQHFFYKEKCNAKDCDCWAFVPIDFSADV